MVGFFALNMTNEIPENEKLIKHNYRIYIKNYLYYKDAQ